MDPPGLPEHRCPVAFRSPAGARIGIQRELSVGGSYGTGPVSLYSGGAAPDFHRTSERPSVYELSTMVPRSAAEAQAGQRGAAGTPSGSEGWAAPAALGELVQGFHRGRWLQIAAPVSLYRQARAEIVAEHPPPRPHGAAPGSHRYTKVQRGLEILLRTRPGHTVRALLGGDEIPRGAGFGSSTADLGAALRAAAEVLGLPEPSEAVVRAALEVEPTGGALLPGLVLFDHRRGTIREPLGPPPLLTLLAIRMPGSVDTVAFNRGLPERLPRHILKRWDRAFRLCTEGIASGDVEQIGAAASESVDLSRHLGCPPAPPGLAVCAAETGAAGVSRAHSGTLHGLLYPGGAAPDAKEVATILRETQLPAGPVLPARSPALVAALELVEGGMRRVSAKLPIDTDADIVARHSERATGSAV